MHNTKQITKDLFYIGANDRRLALFENVFPIENGVSYNSYLLKDEKTVLLDTVDKNAIIPFFENLEYELNGRNLDYIVVNHMEPDHAHTLEAVVEKYPNAKVVCNEKIKQMIKQYFTFDIDSKAHIVKEGDTLTTGNHVLTFVMAPMVHWPEVMVTYDITDKILFSADAFGTFGALNGNIFADEVNFDRDWLDDARRYYTNIVGKYGMPVQTLLKKSSKIDIQMICPLHGPIWRKNLSYFINKYDKWSKYEPEENVVLIMYASVYGHTENTAEILASKLADKGVQNIKMYDVSKTHPSVIVSEAFRCSHLVIASTTYNMGIFCNMETALLDLKAHALQNRKIAIIENGSWAPAAGSLINKLFSEMKDMDLLEPVITLKSSLKNEQLESLNNLADTISESILPAKKEINPMFNINYGLYLLTANENNKDNGCIINTVNQITSSPNLISISVNKNGLTNQMIKNTGKFNISILTSDAPFDLFKHFGFQSGKDCQKFDNFDYTTREENGILSLNKYTNSVISAKVVSQTDYETHTLFIAEVENTRIISDEPSLAYSYYQEHIKPETKIDKKKKGFVCKVCGYIYEGENLPDNYICPICKHGIDAFEPIG